MMKYHLAPAFSRAPLSLLSTLHDTIILRNVLTAGTDFFNQFPMFPKQINIIVSSKQKELVKKTSSRKRAEATGEEWLAGG